MRRTHSEGAVDRESFAEKILKPYLGALRGTSAPDDGSEGTTEEHDPCTNMAFTIINHF